MNTKKSFKSLSLAAATVVWTAAFAAGAFAQGADTAYVPFYVNVDATVTAVPAAGTASVVSQVQMAVTGFDVEAVLRIPLPKTTGVLAGAQKQQNLPAIVSNHGGKIALSLSEQSYKNAEIALFRVNGKRVLSIKTSALGTVSNMPRQNIVAGVYLLSVRGTDGAAFTSRVTHGGGNLDISVVFVGENISVANAASQLTKATAAGDWNITVSAVRYVDTSYVFNPVKGTSNMFQLITLRRGGNGGTSGPDLIYAGQTYKTVVIDGKTWMAENLNYKTSRGSNCYGMSQDSCKKYGMLYDWSAAMGFSSSYNLSYYGGSDVKRQGVCPSGWHLPSRAEWGDLAKAAGGTGDYGAEGTAGTKLKSTSGWYDDRNGTDEYGFSALPGGYWYSAPMNAGVSGYWWTATEYGDDSAFARTIGYTIDYMYEARNTKGYRYSVRCLKN